MRGAVESTEGSPRLAAGPSPYPDRPGMSWPDRATLVDGSVISDVILACYFAGFHAAHGQTPGKALMHLRVVDQAGKKLPPIRALLRALVVIVSMGLLFVPFLYVFLNPQRRAFHDLVVDSYVIES